MTLTLMIMLNVALAITTVAGLAWAMSLPARLAPHSPASRLEPAARETRVALVLHAAPEEPIGRGERHAA
jgi:hypothetical protein